MDAKNDQGCILISVISSKFIQKLALKCQYFTLMDQSVPPDNFHVTCLLREESPLKLICTVARKSPNVSNFLVFSLILKMRGRIKFQKN